MTPAAKDPLVPPPPPRTHFLPYLWMVVGVVGGTTTSGVCNGGQYWASLGWWSWFYECSGSVTVGGPDKSQHPATHTIEPEKLRVSRLGELPKLLGPAGNTICSVDTAAQRQNNTCRV